MSAKVIPLRVVDAVHKDVLACKDLLTEIVDLNEEYVALAVVGINRAGVLVYDSYSSNSLPLIGAIEILKSRVSENIEDTEE